MSIETHHCLCTSILLASTLPLNKLPTRQRDSALICTLTDGHNISHGDAALLQSAVSIDDTPVVIKLEDGFEKRFLARCVRCGVVVGYALDEGMFDVVKGSGRREGVVYVLKGGLVGTEDVRSGRKVAEGEVEMVAA